MSTIYSTKRQKIQFDPLPVKVTTATNDCITAVWLRREGIENDTRGDVVVDVEINGKWYELIREPIESCFSHCARPSAIRGESILNSEVSDGQ